MGKPKQDATEYDEHETLTSLSHENVMMMEDVSGLKLKQQTLMPVYVESILEVLAKLSGNGQEVVMIENAGSSDALNHRKQMSLPVLLEPDLEGGEQASAGAIDINKVENSDVGGSSSATVLKVLPKQNQGVLEANRELWVIDCMTEYCVKGMTNKCGKILLDNFV